MRLGRLAAKLRIGEGSTTIPTWGGETPSIEVGPVMVGENPLNRSASLQ